MCEGGFGCGCGWGVEWVNEPPRRLATHSPCQSSCLPPLLFCHPGRVFSLNPVKGYRPPTLTGHREPLVGVHLTSGKLQEAAGLLGKEAPALYTVSRDGALFAWSYYKSEVCLPLFWAGVFGLNPLFLELYYISVLNLLGPVLPPLWSLGACVLSATVGGVGWGARRAWHSVCLYVISGALAPVGQQLHRWHACGVAGRGWAGGA